MTQIAQYSNKSKTAIALPTLWVSDILAAQHLAGLFKVVGFNAISDEVPAGEHYILAEPNTPEIDIRGIAWKILSSGFECKIFWTNEYFLDQLARDKFTAQHLTIDIFKFARPYTEWAAINDRHPLTPREAALIAKAAIAILPESQKLVELAQLRKRSDASSWDWGKIVKSLEAEFKEELQRRGLVVTNDPDERLRLELLALSKETDPIKRLRKRLSLCSHYRLKSADVEHLCKYLDRRTTQAETKTYDVAQLFEMESLGVEWLIPELLPKGETIILAAAPKAGKTLLAVDAAFAIATGESSFLGERVSQGKVLFISVDESLQSTRNKLIKRGFRREDKDSLRVLPSWTIDQMEVLEAQLEEFRPDVVIIDSLRRINHGSQISENSAEFADNIYTLKETIAKYGASGILIHHTNKNSEAMGVDKIRGNSSITAATWGTWILGHIPKPDPENKKKLIIDPKDPVRVLSVFPREAEGQSLKIEFNPENNSWVRLDGEIQAEAQTMRDRILNILQLNRSGLSGKEMIELLAADKGIYTELNRMVNKRLITSKPAPGNNRYTIYSLPTTGGNTLPPTDGEPIVIREARSYVEQEIQISNSIDNSIQLTDNKLNVLTPELDVETLVSSDVAGIDNSDRQEQGEWVSPLDNDCDSEDSAISVEAVVIAPPDIPPIGSWVRINGKVAKVIKHDPQLSDRVILDGQRAGTFVYGMYPVDECVVLTKLEILQLGLT